MPEFPNSSNIASADYDAERRTLTLRFKRGYQGSYRYEDVPEACFTELCEAPSAGKYFHSNIKGQFLSYRQPD